MTSTPVLFDFYSIFVFQFIVLFVVFKLKHTHFTFANIGLNKIIRKRKFIYNLSTQNYDDITTKLLTKSTELGKKLM